MTTRIQSIFRAARDEHRRLLMPFICGGSPTPDSTAKLIPTLSHAGASIIEIGFPFSDPIADGPVIAAAMHEALVAGVTPESIFEQVASVRDQIDTGLVAMVSVSLVYAHGINNFVTRAKDAGFDGFIFPDAPLEESADLTAAATEAGLTSSLLISPSTPMDRAELITQHCTGFVYVLARSGLTGEQKDAPQVAERIKALKQITTLPIACGFGISTADHVSSVVAHADAAIVGSALVRRLNDARDQGKDLNAAAEDFVADLATGLINMDDLPGIR
ncbi:MAG: tryptophan synthase alpha chain [Phycisphaerales bacterium]|jgi:tryptophan synthase alpha chain